MSDLISRQDAIDMFQRLAYDDWNQCASTTWANAYSEAVDMVRELPSAQPQRTPCDLCKYNPPSSFDGKPCTICPAVGRGESDE